MLKSFLNYIQIEKLFSTSEKILLTISGGIDSIVMCELFHQANLNFGIAHCNFQLRDEESDADELFVEALAEKYDVAFHDIAFDTNAFAKKNKLSIQVAARELRYQWFEEIRKQFNYKLIATAHHRDDSIETFFINLIRGTGISGLHGILPKQGNIIRPMLFTNKAEIELFAKKNKLKYREDSSNASDKYLRNKIRHHIIPSLKELNPNLENTIISNIEYLQDVETIYRKEVDKERKKNVKTSPRPSPQERETTLKRDDEKECTYFISIKALQKLNPIATYLYEFLKPFDFNSNTVDEIIEALDGGSGKQFFSSSSHRLIKDRELLIIEKRVLSSKPKVLSWEVGEKQKSIKLNNHILHFKSEIKNPKSEIIKSSSVAALDFDKLKFPLEIRKWKKGDTFYPLGMKGKKKLSDFFIDKKLSLIQKENTLLLLSNGRIAWVIGQRIDDRFKVTEKTKKIYFAKLA